MNDQQTKAFAPKTPRWLRGVIANSRDTLPALPFQRTCRQPQLHMTERKASIAAR
jgi:hypothetical protein